MMTADKFRLESDGDTVELPDGRLLRVRIEPDQDASINDYDSDGKVAWCERDRWEGHDKPRPEGFTGRARKLTTYNGDAFWWEPYEELTSEQIDAEEDHIRELMTFGFHGVIVELCSGEDHYGRPIVVDSESLWGMDTTEAKYVSEVANDLASELLARS